MKIEQKFNNGRGAFICPVCQCVFATGWDLKENTEYSCRNGHKFKAKLMLETYWYAEMLTDEVF